MTDKDTQAAKSIAQFTQHSGVKLCSEEALFRILSDGSWLYQNSPLPTKFARMFSHILHNINDEYFLITPVEKVRVAVDSWPLLLVDVEENEAGFCFKTSLDTKIQVSKVAVIVEETGIFVKCNKGLVGSLNRACYYRYINEYLSFD
ncbi:DUF1285 domain-containing protein [Shewanella subflava]|uniref:DUF1285 domain-containing protein n=1 Tax=Shewanella subflava TaxID=2986476 RepID=A0ABT3ICU5_9GAMM|nr:DUF1285 domain-containing protein [Shewanella subflava]MCW3173875.1 DUF1285 domain-containing protein [Shewanella subflava]